MQKITIPARTIPKIEKRMIPHKLIEEALVLRDLTV